MSDADLARLLYPQSLECEAREAAPRAFMPDWAFVHRELRRKGVTSHFLWEEYHAADPDGYWYSRFCDLYSCWEGKLSPVIRQHHPAGERLFVEYAGATIGVIAPKTGEVRAAQLLAATLGASNFTFAEAT